MHDYEHQKEQNKATNHTRDSSLRTATQLLALLLRRLSDPATPPPPPDQSHPLLLLRHCPRPRPRALALADIHHKRVPVLGHLPLQQPEARGVDAQPVAVLPEPRLERPAEARQHRHEVAAVQDLCVCFGGVVCVYTYVRESTDLFGRVCV